MAKLQDFEWTHTRVGIVLGGVVSALLILPHMGDGLKMAAKLVNTPDTAYAAKETADEVRSDFNQYITEQRAYTKALNQVIQQQHQQAPNQAPPRVREWQDPDTGIWWCCDPRTDCEQDETWWHCDE